MAKNCMHCGKPLEYLPSISTPCMQWRHASGHYGCNDRTPSHSETYAEPDRDRDEWRHEAAECQRLK